MENYYEVLGITKSATEAEIKSAYRKMAKKYHPDIHPGDVECEKKFRQISEAYGILGDSDKRREYDQKYIEKEEKSNSGVHKKKGSGKEHKANVDFENVYKNFEQFFGFNPYTQDVMNEEKLNPQAVNPLDTTQLFERFMGIK